MVVSRVIELGAGDRDGLVGVVGEDCEGAGSVEAYAFDGVDIDMVLANSLLHAVTNASPDVGGGLFLSTVNIDHFADTYTYIVTCLWLP